LKPHLPCYRRISKNFKKIKYHRKHLLFQPHGLIAQEHLLKLKIKKE
jgi:hypothetical protein